VKRKNQFLTPFSPFIRTFGTSSISSSISSATYSNGFPSSNNNNHNNFANSVFQPPSQMYNGGLSSTPSATTPKFEQQNGGNPTPSPFLLGGETLNVANSTGADKPDINILQKQNEANQGSFRFSGLDELKVFFCSQSFTTSSIPPAIPLVWPIICHIWSRTSNCSRTRSLTRMRTSNDASRFE
jgi:hypothetical protein